MNQVITSILGILFLLGCNEQEQEQTDIATIDINIGNDATILFGDTLILDAGTGFDSYSWNDDLSNEQRFAVTEAGLYWIEVHKNERTGFDSIQIDILSTAIEDCNTTVTFFEKWIMNIPCSYTYSNWIGDDSEIINIRSDKQDVVLSFERDVTFQYDTIINLPESYKNSFSNKILISGDDNQELGVIFFKTDPGTFRNIEGYYLIKENGYYLELMNLSYSSSKTDELKEILSTLQINTLSIAIEDCDTTVTFFEKWINIPCSYTYSNWIGDDSEIINIKSDNQDIVLSFERDVTFQYDTIIDLPESYKNSFNNKILVSDGSELGVIFFKAGLGTFRNIEGYYLIKENSYYLELMNLSYSSSKTSELKEILSTLKSH